MSVSQLTASIEKPRFVKNILDISADFIESLPDDTGAGVDDAMAAGLDAREKRAGTFAQAAAHRISDDRLADLIADRKAHLDGVAPDGREIQRQVARMGGFALFVDVTELIIFFQPVLFG